MLDSTNKANDFFFVEGAQQGRTTSAEVPAGASTAFVNSTATFCCPPLWMPRKHNQLTRCLLAPHVTPKRSLKRAICCCSFTIAGSRTTEPNSSGGSSAKVPTEATSAAPPPKPPQQQTPPSLVWPQRSCGPERDLCLRDMPARTTADPAPMTSHYPKLQRGRGRHGCLVVAIRPTTSFFFCRKGKASQQILSSGPHL